ncbi:hypothetical protein HIM_00149 [Hirsutella minnesotensis 3608]|nr:hypothetical protein HIM_00149 [Hirsutella minnesotensis 3608]
MANVTRAYPGRMSPKRTPLAGTYISRSELVHQHSRDLQEQEIRLRRGHVVSDDLSRCPEFTNAKHAGARQKSVRMRASEPEREKKAETRPGTRNAGKIGESNG